MLKTTHVFLMPGYKEIVSYLNLTLQTRFTAHRPHYSTLVHLDFIIINVQHTFMPGPNMYIVVAISFGILKIHNIVPTKKTKKLAKKD